jgi:hypothetical protein
MRSRWFLRNAASAVAMTRCELCPSFAGPPILLPPKRQALLEIHVPGASPWVR